MPRSTQPSTTAVTFEHSSYVHDYPGPPTIDFKQFSQNSVFVPHECIAVKFSTVSFIFARSHFRACVLRRQCDLASVGWTLVSPHVSLDIVFSAASTTYWASGMAPLMLGALMPLAIFLYGESLRATLGTCEPHVGFLVALKEFHG